MTFLKKIIFNARHIVLYGLILAALVFLLKWLQWKFLIVDNSLDVYIGLIAIFFTFLGVWVATQLAKPKIQTVIVEKEIYVPLSDIFVKMEVKSRAQAIEKSKRLKLTT